MVSGKYVKDYTTQNALGADGKVRPVSVYTGPRFGYSADPETLRLSRRRFGIAAAVCAAAVLVPLLVYTPIIRCWYVMLPLVCALLPVGELLYRAAAVLRRERLIRKERDRAASTGAWSASLLILALLSLLGQIIHAVRGAYTAADWPVSLSALALAVASGWLFSLRGAFATEEIAAE